ncbi:MAG: GTP-binding protein [Bryobacteraceae bacterium]
MQQTRNEKIRNIAIIAHVDHGKTTLVDAMLRQSGIFRANEEVADRVMDSNALERERGITILAKTTGVHYKGVKINIVDTPGHSDFGGEVERALTMVDGVMLLVDASEGPLPQTRYVLMKALEAGQPPILVINKIDRPDARIQEVLNEVFDLFIDLDAKEDQLDFPIIYTNAKEGFAKRSLEEESSDLRPLFEAILEHIPGPAGDPDGILQMQVANLDYSDYLGRLAIGRVINGTLRLGDEVSVCKLDGSIQRTKITKLYTFEGLKRVDETIAVPGQVLAIAGVEGITIGETVSHADTPNPLPPIQIDEPTIAMTFTINSPFSGVKVNSSPPATSATASTKSSSPMSPSKSKRQAAPMPSKSWPWRTPTRHPLIEMMRRYELQVGKPEILTRKVDGVLHELLEPPHRRFRPGVPVGVVMEKSGTRKGKNDQNGQSRLQAASAANSKSRREG